MGQFEGLEGRVAMVTGAARGQGRSHAVALAEQGVDIIAVDLCEDIDTVSYSLATSAELDETARLVEAQDRRIVACKADVRDLDALSTALERGLTELGRLDIVIANAGIAPSSIPVADPALSWGNVLGVNLTGVWNTTHLTKRVLKAGKRGGSIVITSSTAGLKGLGDGTPGGEAYVASKHGLVGLMRALALELAPHSIRVNTVHPTGTNTYMVMNPVMQDWIAENAEIAAAGMQNALPVGLIEASDVTNAIVWLVSDMARYVTGVTLPVDAGFTAR
ncbi:MAG: mycofactocin-coupled SDR family oxidoreductase [Acidimicrobiales bacterium]